MKCHPCTWSLRAEQGTLPWRRMLRLDTPAGTRTPLRGRGHWREGEQRAPGQGEERPRPFPTGDGSCEHLSGIPIFLLFWNNLSLQKRYRNSTKNCHTPFTQILQMLTFHYIHFIFFFSIHTHNLFFLNHLRVNCRPLNNSVCISRTFS